MKTVRPPIQTLTAGRRRGGGGHLVFPPLSGSVNENGLTDETPVKRIPSSILARYVLDLFLRGSDFSR